MEKSPFRVTPATLDVLECLLSGDAELYGLKIAKTVKRPSGSVVPILMRLESHGWVTSQWESGEEETRGPRRRFYQIDSEHMAAARALVAAHRPAAKRGFVLGYPGLEGA